MDTLFLYIDILGFTELIKEPVKVDRLFSVLDQAQLHRDANYCCIAFSDTIVAYNRHRDLSAHAKAVELMFLIELTQELFRRLTGSGIFFRAVITSGEFVHRRLTNMDAFYGRALVDAYRDEKALVGLGLFLDVRLRQYNQVFRWSPFTPKYDFIYLTHQFSCLCPDPDQEGDPAYALVYGEFPLHAECISSRGLENLLYPEIVHFQEIHSNLNRHADPNIREKYRSTWNMYQIAYPGLMKSLHEHNMQPSGVSDLNWDSAKRRFEEERA